MSLKVEHLSASYGPKEVLHDISFSVEKGEFLSILGPNGAGKSTLFRCILGLLSRYSGEVFVNGKNQRTLSVQAASRQIAYIPQKSNSVFHYSVLEVVLMGRTNRMGMFKSPGREDVQACLHALERVAIGHLKDRSFHKLSGGEQQLVLIARALAQDAPVLLLDEPTASLDFGNQMLVLSQMQKLARTGYTVLQTTHHPEQSYLFSDRIFAMKDGRGVAQGKPSEVLTSETVKTLYNARVNVIRLYDDRVRVCVPEDIVM